MYTDPSLALAFKYANSTLLKPGALKQMQDSYHRYDSYNELLQLGVLTMEDIEEESLEIVANKIRANTEKFSSYHLQNTIAGKNLLLLGNAVGLSPLDIEIMVLLVLYQQYAILRNTSFTHGKVNLTGFCQAIAGMLAVDAKAVSAALSPSGRLLKSSLLIIHSHKVEFEEKFDFVYEFDDYVSDDIRTLQQLIALFINPVEDVTLSLEDYHHIAPALDYIVPYVKGALETRVKGCNILLYGPPGTGKTELVKTLAHAVDAMLYEVKNSESDNDAMDATARLRSYNAGCNLLDPQGRYLILFDELEDVTQHDESGIHKKSSRNKAWFNRLLENTIIPTLWTSNQIRDLDPAYIRRFDIVLEVKPPEEQQRIRIMKKSCNTEHFEEHWLEHITKTVVLSPSEGQRIAKVVALAGSQEKSQTHAEQLIQHSYKATTRQLLDFAVKPVTKPASTYQLAWLNTQSNIEQIFAAARASKQGRICLYGPPGCGKTQFAHYLAEQAGMPIISKKASDMIRPYVGETEMSIAQAFKEASEQNALLLIDEADSFFMDRHSLRESWEVTRVNELLVQLEQFDGLFVASTNLLDNFDPASKRRFDFKVEFDYLTSKQTFDIYCSTLHEKPFPNALEKIMLMKNLTPGNFAVAKRQAMLLQQPITNLFLISILQQEAASNPNKLTNRAIGFIH